MSHYFLIITFFIINRHFLILRVYACSERSASSVSVCPCVELSPCQLLKSGLIERHDLYTPQLLLDYLLRVNSVLSHRDAKKWGVMVGKEEGQFVRERVTRSAMIFVVVLMARTYSSSIFFFLAGMFSE